MKRLTATLATLTLAATAALAQPPGGPPPGDNPVDHLAQELTLTDAQKAKVQQIFQDERAKRDAARTAAQSSGKTPTPDERRAQAQAAQAEILQKLGGVLTPAQLDKFKQIQQERRQNMSHGPGAPPASN